MRIALVQLNPTVGDISGNTQRITGWIDRAREGRADLVVFPELAVCGYPPKDLLLMEGFVRACEGAATGIGRQTQGITAVFGVPLAGPPGLGNGLVAYRDGKLLAEYRKRLLPTYDVFDEDRYFEPGDHPCVIEVAGRRVGLAVCEDLWKGEDAGFAARYQQAPDPMAKLAASGVEVVVVPSASPFVLGKGARHRAILTRQAARHRVFVASVNQVGGNDDLVFDGHAGVYDPEGRLVAAGPGFEETMVAYEVGANVGIDDPLQSAPDEELLFKALVLGTRDYLRKTGHAKTIIGLSGGIDSAVAAVVAAAALGPANVMGVSMPGKYSSTHSRDDAQELARRLGIACVTVPIERPFEGFCAALDPALTSQGFDAIGACSPDLTEQNLQSRARGTVLMAISNRTGALVLTTGNKSELAVGYCTLYGDMNGGLAVLSDVPKRQVYALARWINANWKSTGNGSTGSGAGRFGAIGGPVPGGTASAFTGPIPESTITKPPSAELAPNQTDQDTLPAYDVVDQVVERYVERHESPARIAAETGIDAATVTRLATMIDRAEFKRKQLATGLKVTSVAFGSGRRFPIAQGWRSG